MKEDGDRQFRERERKKERKKTYQRNWHHSTEMCLYPSSAEKGASYSLSLSSSFEWLDNSPNFAVEQHIKQLDIRITKKWLMSEVIFQLKCSESEKIRETEIEIEK